MTIFEDSLFVKLWTEHISFSELYVVESTIFPCVVLRKLEFSELTKSFTFWSTPDVRATHMVMKPAASHRGPGVMTSSQLESGMAPLAPAHGQRVTYINMYSMPEMFSTKCKTFSLLRVILIL